MDDAGISAIAMTAWSIVNARRMTWYEPQGGSALVCADGIRELMLERARQIMVQVEARGGKGSR